MVYIVVHQDNRVQAVFSTKELAQAYIHDLETKKGFRKGTWLIEEHRIETVVR